MENIKNRYKELETILVIITGLILLHIWFSIDGFLYGALAIGISTLVSATLRKWIVLIWIKLSLALGYVNGRILLIIIFYCFLTPIALLSRLFSSEGKLIKQKKETSYFTERNHTFSAKDLEKPW